MNFDILSQILQGFFRFPKHCGAYSSHEQGAYHEDSTTARYEAPKPGVAKQLDQQEGWV